MQPAKIRALKCREYGAFSRNRRKVWEPPLYSAFKPTQIFSIPSSPQIKLPGLINAPSCTRQLLTMKNPSKKSASATASAKRSANAASARPTIAHTLAADQRDPKHSFHDPAQKGDGRIGVAAGERLQRVRARAPAN